MSSSEESDCEDRVLTMEEEEKYILNIAKEQHDQDVSKRTNKAYQEVMDSKYGWKAFLDHMSIRRGVIFTIYPLPEDERVALDLIILYFTLKGKLGNQNAVGFKCTQISVGPLAPGTVDTIYASMLKYYSRKYVLDPSRPNLMRHPEFVSFYVGMSRAAKRAYKTAQKGLGKKPLYYYDMEKIILKSYLPNFIRTFDKQMGYWFRAWVTLSYAMFMRGEELCDIWP